jgi:hypothetical protein
VIHDLQQDAEHVRMRLLDLVEQQHGVRRLAHRVDEQPAFLVADVAGRRADQRDTACFSMYSDMS